MGQIHGENTDLTGGTQVCVPVTRQKYHRPRHNQVLDGYDNFNTYVVVGSLRATTNIGRLDLQCHVMNLYASKLLSRIYHNNNNKTVLQNLFVPYLCKSYKQLLSQIE